jgi:hypothetical protein
MGREKLKARWTAIKPLCFFFLFMAEDLGIGMGLYRTCVFYSPIPLALPKSHDVRFFPGIVIGFVKDQKKSPKA